MAMMGQRPGMGPVMVLSKFDSLRKGRTNDNTNDNPEAKRRVLIPNDFSLLLRLLILLLLLLPVPP